MMLLSTSPYLGHIITTEIVVWGICIGAILAFTLYFFQQHILGSLVRSLLSVGVGEENAKSLSELNKNKAFYRHFLGDNSTLRKIVSVVGGVIPRNPDGAPDFDSARFFIDQDKLELAKKRYERDTRLWVYIVGVLACLAVGLVMHFVFPILLDLLPEV